MGNSRIYGYDKDHGRLVINEPEAEMVRLIFTRYSNGLSLRAIERELYDKGYRSRNGNKINHNTIGTIINNPKYKGYYCGNKVKIADYRTKEQIFLPEEDWITYKDETGKIVPAIVSEELWNIANGIFKERSSDVKRLHSKGKKATSVLSGKVICGHHNTPFWRTSYSHVLHRDENIYQWVCREKKRNKSECCPTFAIYETELYDMLGKFFSSIINDIDGYIDTFIEMYKKYDDAGRTDKEITKFENVLVKIENKKNKLLELYTDNLLPKEDFKAQNDKLNTEMTETKDAIEQLSNSKKSKDTVQSDLNNIKKIISAFINAEGEEFTRADIDKFVTFVIDKIIVTGVDKKTLSLNIILKNGSDSTVAIMRSFGRISKKMIDSYKTQH